MTKAQIIKALEPYPDTIEVFIEQLSSSFRYGGVNTVEKRTINFFEDPDDEKPLAADEVIVLSED